MTDDLTNDEEAAVLERIVRNKLAIKELEEENAALLDYFKGQPEKYPAGSTTTNGKFYVTVSSNSRIDNTLAAQHLNYNELRRVRKEVIDPAKARRYLPAATLDKITKTYDNRIEVGLN